ncbi:MAG TPA: response regulator transcription factor [Candidatus Acidoferrum sp.]|nr:response regulator transcription factor [Candidatus Acidoferrum sp.]
MNILVVEDDPHMAQLLAQGLREESHEVDIARDGNSALAISSRTPFDVILLDVMLPGVDGLEVARQLRRRVENVPVLMLTARDALGDIVKGLDAGADDYLTKPFSFAELLARVRALGRRVIPKVKNVLEVGDLVLDVSTFRAFRKGNEILLSLTEFRLLELLARNQGKIVSRQTIQDVLWGHRREIEENTIDAFVHLLRKKVEATGGPRLIHTHRGFGYSLGVYS